jgi:hypothetical protein
MRRRTPDASSHLMLAPCNGEILSLRVLVAHANYLEGADPQAPSRDAHYACNDLSTVLHR